MNDILENAEIRDVPAVEASADLKTEWIEHFAKAICSAKNLANIALPQETKAWHQSLHFGQHGQRKWQR